MTLFRILPLVLGGAALAAYGKQRVICADYTTGSRARPSLTTFPKPVNSHTWTRCSDNETRSVTCTPGHLSAWKCTCAVDGVDAVESRRATDVQHGRALATADANQMCHWDVH